MRHMVLGLLMLGPQSLYDLRRRFASGLAHIYGASFGSLHRVLGQLVSAGHAEVENEQGSARGRKIYSPTSAGRAAWREWMIAPDPSESLEPAMLARVHLLGLLPDEDDRVATLDALITLAAHHRAQLEAIAAEAPEAASPWSMATLDHGLQSHRLTQRWLDDLRHHALAGTTPRSHP